MITFTHDSDLSVPPMTDDERRWIRKLDNLMKKCPSRFEFMVSGNPSVSVVDKYGATCSDLADGAARDDGVLLATIHPTPTFHGVSE